MAQNGIERTIAEHLFRHYGVKGSLKRLAGQNLNYLVCSENGERFVTKIVGEDEPDGVSDMEFALLEYARNAGFSLELPSIIKTYNKKYETTIKLTIKRVYRLRLMAYIEGAVLEDICDISSELLKSCGKTLAAFDRALEGFDHPAAHRAGDWELPRAGRQREKLGSIEDPVLRHRVAWAFDRWAEVQPALHGLPRQLIHGDANKENIIVRDERVSGLVDFGDACFNPRVCELAICLAYLMMDREDPMDAAGIVVRAYCEELQLLDQELAVLFQLVCGRLAVSICMASGRLQEERDNPNLFVSLEPAAALLEKMHGIGVQRMC